MTDYDVAIIGGGPGGYNCAIRCGQLGLKTVCIEKHDTLGGVCLNVGCIPSKALLHASELYKEAQTSLPALGIKTGDVGLDLDAMMVHKAKTVDGLTKGVAFLFKKNKVESLQGTAQITSPNSLGVESADGVKTSLKARHIVIASGSKPTPLSGVEIDEERFISSTGALSLNKVPKHLLVVGAGVIGLELGSVWHRLGAEVTVIEYLDQILPGMDGEICRQAQRVFKKQGFHFRLGQKVVGSEKTKTGVRLVVEPAKGGKQEKLDADIALIAIGRTPYTEGLGLEALGVQLNTRGFIETRDFQTSVPGIWAIGDCTTGPMLAHKAEDEGVAVAERLAGKAGHVNKETIPGVVYTHPEIAAVGKTEEQLKKESRAYKAGKFPFTANSRARASACTEGFVKILADADTDEILGVHMMGAGAGEMIAEAVLAMEFKASSEDIARTCHPHPTLTEAIRQAAMGVEGWTMQM